MQHSYLTVIQSTITHTHSVALIITHLVDLQTIQAITHTVTREQTVPMMSIRVCQLEVMVKLAQLLEISPLVMQGVILTHLVAQQGMELQVELLGDQHQALIHKDHLLLTKTYHHIMHFVL